MKGILAGLCAGLVYKALSGKHPLGAVTCAGIVAPVVNSGIFVLGCYIFIWDELMELAAANGVGIAMLLLGLVVINFVLELILNIVLCPSIFRVIQIVTKNIPVKGGKSGNRLRFPEKFSFFLDKADFSCYNR